MAAVRPARLCLLVLGLTVFLQLGVGCDPEDAPPLVLDGASLRGSSWEGQLTTRQAEGPASIPVKLAFALDATFTATNLAADDSLAKGRYRDMPAHRSVMLEVEESSFPQFAAAGAFLTFDYSNKDNELVVQGDDLAFRLLRKEAPGQDQTNNPLQGSWLCPEATGGARWQLDITGTRFWARRALSGHRALRLEGEVVYEKATSRQGPTTATLITTSATNNALLGAKWRFAVAGKQRLFQELTAEGEPRQDGLAMHCQNE